MVNSFSNMVVCSCTTVAVSFVSMTTADVLSNVTASHTYAVEARLVLTAPP